MHPQIIPIPAIHPCVQGFGVKRMQFVSEPIDALLASPIGVQVIDAREEMGDVLLMRPMQPPVM